MAIKPPIPIWTVGRKKNQGMDSRLELSRWHLFDKTAVVEGAPARH